MLHPISRRAQTLRRVDLKTEPDGVLVRRERWTLDDVYRRIDEDLTER